MTELPNVPTLWHHGRMDGNTEHGARYTEQPADGPTLRSATPGGAPVQATLYRGTATAVQVPPADGTRQVTGAVRTAERTAHRAPHRGPVTAFREWRARTARTAEQHREEATAARQVRDDERAAVRRRDDARRTTAARAAVQHRRGTATAGRTGRPNDPDTIAPIPRWMTIIGIWAGRIFGAWPLIAPLLVSGYFTTQVFHDAPIDAPIAVALIVTGALEGGLYKLSTLLKDTLLEGDSTVGLRFGIFCYVTMIGGLIYWHAGYLAAADQGVGFTEAKIGVTWIPAAGSAVFALLGVYIYGRDARFKHRVQLRAQGKIDRQAPKFSLLSWVLCPWETPHALRHAIKFRLERPLDAITDYRFYKAAGKPKLWPAPEDVEAAADLPVAELLARIATASPVLGRTLAARYADDLEEALADGTLSEVFQDGTLAWLEADLTGRPLRSAAARRGTGTAPVSPAPYRRALPPAAERGTPAPRYNGAEHPQGPDGADARTAAADGADGTDGTDGTDGADPSAPLPYADFILTITEAFPNWQQQGQMPKVREALAAVSAERERREGRPYKSMSTIAKVMKVLAKLADDDGIAAALDRMRTDRTTAQ